MGRVGTGEEEGGKVDRVKGSGRAVVVQEVEWFPPCEVPVFV